MSKYNLEENELIKQVVDKEYYLENPIYTLGEAVNFIVDEFHDYDRELFISINLDSNMVPLNFSINHIGALDRSVVHPREVFKSAILSRAKNIVLMHNHPGGTLVFSDSDYATTKALKIAAELVDLNIIDHYVFTPSKETIAMDGLMINEENYQVSLDMELSGSKTFSSVETRFINLPSSKIAIETPSDIKSFSRHYLYTDYSTHMIYLNKQNEVLGYLGNLDYEGLMNDITNQKEIFQSAVLASTSRMILLLGKDKQEDFDMFHYENFEQLIDKTNMLGIYLLDILKENQGENEFRSLRRVNPGIFEEPESSNYLENIENKDNDLRKERRLTEIKDIENEVRNLIEKILETNEIYDTQITGLKVYGSYAELKDKDTSDIDVLVEFDTTIKEDVLFNLINNETNNLDDDLSNLTWNGIKLDINPIRPEQSGTIEEYLYHISSPSIAKEKDEWIDFGYTTTADQHFELQAKFNFELGHYCYYSNDFIFYKGNIEEWKLNTNQVKNLKKNPEAEQHLLSDIIEDMVGEFQNLGAMGNENEITVYMNDEYVWFEHGTYDRYDDKLETFFLETIGGSIETIFLNGEVRLEYEDLLERNSLSKLSGKMRICQ